MASSDLTFEQILKYFIDNGGVADNREVVRHFKHYLTDPATKDDARAKFKLHINALATNKIVGERKMLYLKSKYHPNTSEFVSGSSVAAVAPIAVSPKYDSRNAVGLPVPVPSLTSSPVRTPPPYRPPPPVTSPTQSVDNISLGSNSSFATAAGVVAEPTTPQAPPRRKTSDRLRPESADMDTSVAPEKENEQPDNGDKQMVSVKERTQKFNRMASTEEEAVSPKQNSNRVHRKSEKGSDEADGAVVTSVVDSKRCAEWYVAAAKADYQELAKLARSEPKFVKLKDPFTAYTVLHWGAKHGNVDIIKLFAGTYKADVNAKSNGGYVPLHLAAQFGREDVYKILIEVYNADASVRDFSGKKPEHYRTSDDQTPKTTHSEYLMPAPKHDRKHSFRKSFRYGGFRASFRPGMSYDLSPPRRTYKENF